ncbi:uncharacterized protein LOC131855532 [Achroia grisella]|uniref:uncharacterized protein LOC131855532 n=1 Tax=Achroia grisella TaxID=688607 RepID=UPI0027D28754|nr:uncharacterized protein LOC131855532 [Achroia grisella]
MHRSCSIFQAELLAIGEACRMILAMKHELAYILTDSKSSLMELSNPASCNSLVNKIFKHLRVAEVMKVKIVFVWLRAHVGIRGNEDADCAAKQAASSKTSLAYDKFPISYVKQHFKTTSTEDKINLYNNENNCKYTKQISPYHEQLELVMRAFPPDFHLTQFYSGHGYHKVYLKRFGITADDECPCDANISQTMEHLIRVCPRFSSTRMDHEIANRMVGISEPYDFQKIIKKETTINTFSEHIKYIIRNLKQYNQT